jgi:tRNA-specific 2-thiouridylase
LSPTLRTDQASWIAGTPPEFDRLMAKTRYRQADVAGSFSAINAHEFQLTFDQAQWAVTPGQSAVLYQGEVCLGGGIISN